MPRRPLPPRLDRIEDTWYILWHDGRRDRRTSARTRDQLRAERALSEFLIRRGEAAQQLRRPDEIPIAEALGDYLKKVREKPGAKAAATRAIALLNYWRSLPIDAVTAATVAGYVRHRKSMPGRRRRPSIADWTIFGELSVLRAALKHMENSGQLTRAPFVALPPEPPGRDVWLETWEADLLIQCCVEPHLALFVEATLHTVARKTAICQLQWRGQIDFTRRRIDLNPPGRAQTSKRRPVVPMTEHIYEVLLAAHGRASSARM
jgi:hypothetical protein